MSDERQDPFAGFNFIMAIDGLDDSVIAFKEISGIESKTEVIEYQEGGLTNNTIRKIPGRTNYSNIVAKRGISDSLDIWEWYQSIVDSSRDVERLDATITLLDSQGEGEQKVYNLSGVWPCRYKGPDLDAQADSVTFEEIEFVYEALEITE